MYHHRIAGALGFPPRVFSANQSGSACHTCVATAPNIVGLFCIRQMDSPPEPGNRTAQAIEDPQPSVWRVPGPDFRFYCGKLETSLPEASAATFRPSVHGVVHGTNSGEADRALLLADAERLENLDHARGVRAAVHRAPGQHRPGGPVQAGISGDLAQ